MTNAANTAGEMEAGDLIADTQLLATQPVSLGGAQIAFMNAGGVRNPGFVKPASATYPYKLTYGDAFTVQPFGNSLVTLTLTAAQIKTVLEQQFSGCLGQTANRVMQVSACCRRHQLDPLQPNVPTTRRPNVATSSPCRQA